jgi:hypothetical protein
LAQVAISLAHKRGGSAVGAPLQAGAGKASWAANLGRWRGREQRSIQHRTRSKHSNTGRDWPCGRRAWPRPGWEMVRVRFCRVRLRGIGWGNEAARGWLGAKGWRMRWGGAAHRSLLRAVPIRRFERGCSSWINVGTHVLSFRSLFPGCTDVGALFMLLFARDARKTWCPDGQC